MPISYEPMQPFDKSVYEAYGASQARQQANEMALRAYGITQASADRRQEMAQQEEQFNASYQQRFQLQDSAQAHDFAKAQQHTDLQAQLSQTQLNQAENMRLQRLDRQIEYVQANSGPGQQYTPQEAQEMIGDLRMGRDPLQARALRAQTLNTQWQTEKHQQDAAKTASIVAANANFDANNVAGTVRHFEDQSTGEDLGPHQWDRNKAQWVPINPGRASGSGASGGSVSPRQLSTQQLLDSYMHSQPKPAAGEPASPPPTAEQLDNHAKMLEKLDQERRERAREQTRRERGMTRLFDPLPNNRQPANHTEMVQQSLSNSALDAHRTHRLDDEDVIREIGGRLRDKNQLGGNITTGQLTPEQQQSLQSIVPGYYHGDFTPALDRELGRIESGQGQTFAILPGGQRPNVENRPESQAARGIRNTLGKFGSMENLDRRGTEQERADFRNFLATIRVFNWGGQANEGGSRLPRQPTNQADVMPAPRPRPSVGPEAFNPNLYSR